ncbi:asparagine synthase (glutamine-hydrolyzing) [Thalassospira tepidiphila]|uniref:asparagine synthase (glutamine-hydrolyzing) n=1 Tax=Thalassospira tepidiphila TaxID=393657 RepID=UPI003AA844CF
MCGFVAEIRLDNTPVDRKTIEQQAELINHRGPDDKGIFIDDWCALVFRRLAIIDISPMGRQPMRSTCERYVMVFNGEIYNFETVRDELIDCGFTFRSSSDSEVFLNSFIHWGKHSFSKIRGMFSFVIVDLQLKNVYFGRDHIGIKPLYRLNTKNGIHLASEIKAYLPLEDLQLNEAVIEEQLSFGYVAGRNTLFSNVQRIEPGILYTYHANDKSVSEFQFYDILNGLNSKSSVQSDEAIRRLIDDSIREHTISDDGYNIQLSGGVDSSYITAMLSQDREEHQRCYSANFEGPLSEKNWQNLVVEKYSAELHSFTWTGEDLSDFYVNACWHLDMPNVHLASPFLLELCKESAKTSKVILTGEGADELFAGYSRFKTGILSMVAHKLRRWHVSGKWLPNLPKIRALKLALDEDPVNTCQRVISKENVNNILARQKTSHNFEYRAKSSGNYKSLATSMIANHQKCYLQSLLERQDKVSMAASVEARVPFCTPQLFDAINPIPTPKKLHRRTPKAILKRIALRYFDSSFLNRKKSGFTIPIDEWLRDPDGMGRFIKNLQQPPFNKLDLFNHAFIEKMIQEHLNNTNNWHKELISLINFDIWYRLFISRCLKPEELAPITTMRKDIN